jgi:Protein of unknown function (DUF3043)
VFRRRSGGAPDVLESDQQRSSSDQAGKPAGKGRPTPKRSEVERRRRQPYTPPPTDRKTSAAAERVRRRTESKRRMDAMRRGEEWAIPRKDQGQVKALARDYIDSRRVIVSEYVLFGVFALIFLLFVLGAAKNSSMILYVELGILALITVESQYHSFRVIRLARQRCPGQSTRGIGYYILKRSIRLRSTRIPPARVARGSQV